MMSGNFEANLFNINSNFSDPFSYEKYTSAAHAPHTNGKELSNDLGLTLDTNISSLLERTKRNIKKNLEHVTVCQVECEKEFCEKISKFGAAYNELPFKLKQSMKQLKIECDNHLEEKDKIIKKLEEDVKQKHAEFAAFHMQRESELHALSERCSKLVTNLYEIGEEEIKAIQFALNHMKKQLIADNGKEQDQNIINENIYRVSGTVEKDTYKSHQYQLITDDQLNSLKCNVKDQYNDLLLYLRKVEVTNISNLDKVKHGLTMLNNQIKANKITSCETKQSNVRAFDRTIKIKQVLKAIQEEEKRVFMRYLTQHAESKAQLLKLIKITKCNRKVLKKKFHDAIKMQKTEIINLIHEILKVDAFITMELLDSTWKCPDLSFMEKGEYAAEVELKTVTQWVNYLEKHEAVRKDEVSVKPEIKSEGKAVITEAPTLFYVTHPLNIRKLLEFICFALDGIFEENVLKLSKSTFPDVASFILTNSVFNAMELSKIEDLNHLLAHVLKYSQKVTDQDQLILNSKDVLSGFYDFNSEIVKTYKSFTVFALLSHFFDNNYFK